MTDAAPALAPLWSPALVRVTVTLMLGAAVANLFVIAPRFLGDAGYDKHEIGIVMGAFNGAALVGFPVIAWLTARFGYARVISAGCVVTALGALAFALASELVGYTAARAVQGLGLAALMVGAASFVAEIAPPGRLGEALGVSGILTLVAQAIGPALAQVIHDHAGWPWVWRAGIVSGLAAAAVAITLPAVPRRPDDAAAPRRAAAIVLIATALAGIGFGVIWTFLADYGPKVGVPTVTGFFVAYVVAAVATRLTIGTLSDRVGRRVAATPALIGHTLALIGMSQLGARWHLIAIGLGYGLCHGIYYPTLQALTVERSGGSRSHAIAAFTFAFGAGIVIAAFALGPVARAYGYTSIYMCAAAAGAASAALVWWRA